MKKHLVLLILFLHFGFSSNAQSRGIKIGYIDMEYILQNVPDYTEAKGQLEQKAEKWKQDIETKKVEIAKLKDALKTEKALLTKELIADREEEIQFQEDELIAFQQKKFGPNGDLITQKAVLVKPIQDQVFAAVQDIADLRKYDFIFDKSSDLTMLFAAKRHDISDLVLRSITRANKRQQLSKKELKEEEKKEYEENLEDANPALQARRKVLEERKQARDKLMEERKQMIEQKKKEQEEKRQQLIDEKEAKKSGTVPASQKTDDKINTNPSGTAKPAPAGNKTEPNKPETTAKPAPQSKDTNEPGKATTSKPEAAKPATDNSKTEAAKANADEKIKAAEDAKKAKEAARNLLLEERKKALEEKKKKMLEQRDSIQKAREEKMNEKKTN